MQVPLADRLLHVEEYFFSKKLREVANLNAEGAEVVNLGPGGPDLPPSTATRGALAAAAQQPQGHGYQPYNGVPVLREALAAWYLRTYKVQFDARSEVLPLLGSKEGVFFVSLAFLNPGDQVLVPDPGYPSYAAVTKLVGAVPVPYDLKEAENWQIDLEALRQRDLSGVKLMWVNSPHMPTGATLSRQQLTELVAFAREHGILLCHDNPYSLILTQGKPQSVFQVEGAFDCAIELNSLSKSHNMAGWRIGMVLGCSEYLRAILAIQSNMASGMFLPVQLAAVEALKNSPEWHREQNEIYRERRRKVCEIMDLLGCSYERERPGLFVWAKAPDAIRDIFAFLDQILYGAHVFLTPGAIFGRNGERYIRASLCVRSELLDLALARVARFLKKEGQKI